jgi:hypothetical protein
MKIRANSLKIFSFLTKTFGFVHGWQSLLLLTALALAQMNCGQNKEALIQQKIAEKTVAFRTKKSAECRESLLQLAEKTVDSLLLAEAQQQLLDSLSRSKPGRPLRPPAVPPIDSLAIKPIFEH